MLVTRKIKGQVQTYEYRQKPNANNTRLNIRLNDETFAKLKCLSEYHNYKNYSQYIRELIEEKIKQYTFVETTKAEDSSKTFKVAK